MEEIDPWQCGGYGSAFLVHVGAHAGYVGVVTDDRKGLCACGGIAPRQVRVQVFAEADMMGGIRRAKRELSRDFVAIRKAGAGQFHGCFP
jgi:hypothetical protein